MEYAHFMTVDENDCTNIIIIIIEISTTITFLLIAIIPYLSFFSIYIKNTATTETLKMTSRKIICWDCVNPTFLLEPTNLSYIIYILIVPQWLPIPLVQKELTITTMSLNEYKQTILLIIVWTSKWKKIHRISSYSYSKQYAQLQSISLCTLMFNIIIMHII